MGALIGIIILVLLAAFWYSSMQARALAVALAVKICEQNQWQWLDQCVSLKKITLCRSECGHFLFWRKYQFEYGVEHRHVAAIIVFDKRVWLAGGKIDIEGELESASERSDKDIIIKKSSVNKSNGVPFDRKKRG